MVSQLGNNEMAAVTAANVPVFLLISIVFGVQSGVGILISQYWGKKDLPSISRAIGVAAGLGMALALVIALALFLWPGWRRRRGGLQRYCRNGCTYKLQAGSA